MSQSWLFSRVIALSSWLSLCFFNSSEYLSNVEFVHNRFLIGEKEKKLDVFLSILLWVDDGLEMGETTTVGFDIETRLFFMRKEAHRLIFCH